MKQYNNGFTTNTSNGDQKKFKLLLRYYYYICQLFLLHSDFPCCYDDAHFLYGFYHVFQKAVSSELWPICFSSGCYACCFHSGIEKIKWHSIVLHYLKISNGYYSTFTSVLPDIQ